MRVIIMLSSFSAGGSERVAIDVANELANNGHKVILYAIRDSGEYKTQVSGRVEIYYSSSERAVGSVGSLARLIKKFPPHFIFTSQYYLVALAYLAKVASGKRRLKIIGREATTPSAADYSTLKGRCLRMLVGFVYQRIDILISPCEFVRKDVIDFYQLNRKVVVSYNPLNVNKIRAQASNDIFHDLFEIPNDEPLIVSVGRLHSVKNFSFLIESFAKLNDQMPSRLVILGEGAKRKSLEKLIEKLKLTDRVSMLGFTENPFTYIAKADVLALTSKFEGYPNVLLQAMVLGVPSVAVDCPGGIREILTNDYISKMSDHDAFVTNLKKVIAGAKGQNVYRQEKNYNDISSFVENLIFLYKSVC